MSPNHYGCEWRKYQGDSNILRLLSEWLSWKRQAKSSWEDRGIKAVGVITLVNELFSERHQPHLFRSSSCVTCHIWCLLPATAPVINGELFCKLNYSSTTSFFSSAKYLKNEGPPYWTGIRYLHTHKNKLEESCPVKVQILRSWQSSYKQRGEGAKRAWWGRSHSRSMRKCRGQSGQKGSSSIIACATASPRPVCLASSLHVCSLVTKHHRIRMEQLFKIEGKKQPSDVTAKIFKAAFNSSFPDRHNQPGDLLLCWHEYCQQRTCFT